MTQREWQRRFVAELVRAGLDRRFAVATFKASEHDLSVDPEEAAEGELDAIAASM